MKLHEIIVRDPFILPVASEKNYYLYGSPHTFVNPDGESWSGIYCWKSADLSDWSGPVRVFTPPEELAPCQFWAPEVHVYRGAYYMFVTFPKAPQPQHTTHILRAEKPDGPFRIWSEGALCPPGWQTLDGTLFVDENAVPWLVFCHEWVQIHDGTICAMPLSDDLKRPAGAVTELFHASEAPWALRFGTHNKNAVTDGPFLFREGGKLKMFWSSLMPIRCYAMGVAVSESGKLTGPWRQSVKPICNADCGHGMRFLKFDGTPEVVVHQPNSGNTEHPVFLSKIDEDMF